MSFIALDEAGALGIDALLDEEVQRLAWENHASAPGCTTPLRTPPNSG